GFNAGEGDSATFTVVPPLKVFITAPADGTAVAPGASIDFQGDVESLSLPDESFVWSYGDVAFATGRHASAVLPEGTHVVTLKASTEDSEGEASVTVTVGQVGGAWIRCDASGDGKIDLSDPVGMLHYLFVGDFTPRCLEALNCDGKGRVDL